MYRPILDSGWVDVDDVTVIVGKNESGKTALLRALHKFNPFTPDRYTLDREWPRSHRKCQSGDTEVVTVRFHFDEEEVKHIIQVISNSNETDALPNVSTSSNVSGVEVSRTYNGNFRYRLLPDDTIIQRKRPEIKRLLEQLNTITENAPVELKGLLEEIEQTAADLVQKGQYNHLEQHLTESIGNVRGSIIPEDILDEAFLMKMHDVLGQLLASANTSQRRTNVERLVRNWIPIFVYMDDHKPFRGSAQLDQIRQRTEDGQPTDEDKTFLMIMDMAGLDFEKELERAVSTDKEQRMLDMSDASTSLTELLASHWTQRKYQVRFEADGYHIIMFVSDNVQTALVPLDERSKGFQWFFSFDATLLHETEGTFKGGIILLDEPGLHLHASAQRDLLTRLKLYAQSNQVIYSTHMPFMIDMERLDNIRVCVEDEDQGTIVSADYYSTDAESRFPLQAALGLSLSQSLFVSQFNLVVEGVTDFWLISAMAAMFRSEDRSSLDARIVITPGGGATKAAYVATMLSGQQLNVVVLLDSDAEGKIAADGLIKDWLAKDKQVLLLGKIARLTGQATLEDLFTDDLYLEYVNQAYGNHLGQSAITQEEIGSEGNLVDRIERVMVKRGFPLNTEKKAFNKGRVAKAMLADLPTRDLSKLPKEVSERFERLFTAVNKAMPNL